MTAPSVVWVRVAVRQTATVTAPGEEDKQGALLILAHNQRVGVFVEVLRLQGQ